MILFPKAKINLGLNVISKREDGFHNIESIFYPISLHDVLEVIPSDTAGIDISITGIIPDGEPSENLVVKGYKEVAKKFTIPGVKVHLHKNIPMGAGLGGGSSDAAEMVKMLNLLFNLSMSTGDMKTIVSNLGSDCAFFIEGLPSLATGKGELLERNDLDLSSYHIGIVYPNVHVNTREAYSGIIPASPVGPLQDIVKQNISFWKEYLMNDFELTVFSKYPQISEAKTYLYDSGALYASMSGSGSCCYGIFKDKIQAESIFWV